MNPETAAAVKDMREAAEYRRLKPELEAMAAKLAMWDALVKGLYRALPYAIVHATDRQHISELMEAQDVLNRARALQVKP